MSGAAAKSNDARENATARRAGERTPAASGGTHQPLLGLQRAVGNRALTSLVNAAEGERLPDSLEAMFSRKFGQDLSHVTIHRDGRASEAVHRLGANAFARGSQVFFRTGAFQPDTSAGQALLAHELAHVVQQTRSAGSPAAGRGSAETHAQAASATHMQGGAALNAGPAAPVGVAADNGVVYEDEEQQASVLATRDEALDTILDSETEAQQRRDDSGVTDIRTGHLDDQAHTLRQALAPAAPKKTSKKSQKPEEKPQQPELPVSSPDLRDASTEDIRAHRRALLETQLATTDPAARDTLSRDIENTTGAIDYAGRTTNIVFGDVHMFGLRDHEAARVISSLIVGMRDDAEALEAEVYRAHKNREETSSWVTGPIHFWGGAWSEMEASDFQQTNILRLQAAEALKHGQLTDALYLLNRSADELDSLTGRFGDYSEGIQKGGGRMVKLFSTTERVSRGVLNVVNPAAGLIYGFGQSSLQQEMMVQRGLADKVDYWGNLKGAAFDAAVGKISGGASSWAGAATKPFLGTLGSQAVGLVTGIGASSAVTRTNPIDAFKDPANLFVMVIAHDYEGGGRAGGSPTEVEVPSLPEVPTTAALPEVSATAPQGVAEPVAAAPEPVSTSESVSTSEPAPVPEQTAAPESVVPEQTAAASAAAPEPVSTPQSTPVPEQTAAPEPPQVPEQSAAPEQAPAPTQAKSGGKPAERAAQDPMPSDIEVARLEEIARRRKMAKGGGLVDEDFQPGPAKKPKAARSRGERTPGRSEVSQRVKSSQRRTARQRFGKKLQEALRDPGKHTRLTQLTDQYLTYGQRARVIRTGELPPDIPFHHFLSVADFPEFAGMDEAGAGLPEDVHAQAGHGGDTTRPLEAATMIDPGAEEAVPFNEDPMAAKGARAPSKRAQILEGDATSSKGRGGVDSDARIVAEEMLRTLQEQQAARRSPSPRLAQQIADTQAFIDSLTEQ